MRHNLRFDTERQEAPLRAPDGLPGGKTSVALVRGSGVHFHVLHVHLGSITETSI